jgi:two-component system sensor histidine kinase VicK
MKSTTKKILRAISSKDVSQLQVLFDNTNEHAICLLDRSGKILSWNLSAERLMGYTANEIIGKNYSIFFSKEEILRNVVKKTLYSAERRGRYTADGIRVRKNGSHFWARSFVTPVIQGKKIPLQFVLITRDITRDRALEQKKEEYIGIASHELRTPIQTLSLYSELLSKRLGLEGDKENLQTLRDIQGQTARLVTLIDDLLLVSKVEGDGVEIRREKFDPVLMLRKILADYKNLASTNRLIFKGKRGRLVRADKNRIAQVLINLLTNAVKYSPQTGRIVVRVERKAHKCVISIQDSGPGISIVDQRHIFDRFYRAKSAGAPNIAGVGLGLYISKEIIKKHRERLWVKSSSGKGTTFFFTLPLVT